MKNNHHACIIKGMFKSSVIIIEPLIGAKSRINTIAPNIKPDIIDIKAPRLLPLFQKTPKIKTAETGGDNTASKEFTASKMLLN